MQRRHSLTAIAAFVATWASVLQVKPVLAVTRELPSTKSLQSDIALALKASKPLVVLVSLDNCPFCKIARENYLIPLMVEQAITVVQVNISHDTAIQDAQGKPTTHEQLIRYWSIKAAPTVLFLGKGGREIAPRLVGGTSSDFYGAYLQERIDQAIKFIKSA